MYSEFGLDHLDRKGQLDALMRELPAVRPSIAQIMTATAYQTEFGLYDHAAPGNHGLALVAMHPKEDVIEGGPTFTHIRRFFHYRIHKHFSLSLEEFMGLPPYVTELLYDMARGEATRTTSTLSSIEREMEEEFDT